MNSSCKAKRHAQTARCQLCVALCHAPCASCKVKRCTMAEVGTEEATAHGHAGVSSRAARRGVRRPEPLGMTMVSRLRDTYAASTRL